PKRLPVLWAKILVFAAVSFLLALPSVLIAFWASQAILSRHHILQVSLSDNGVARSVVGGALYLTLFGVFCLALGAIVRNTEGGVGEERDLVDLAAAQGEHDHAARLRTQVVAEGRLAVGSGRA